MGWNSLNRPPIHLRTSNEIELKALEIESISSSSDFICHIGIEAIFLPIRA